MEKILAALLILTAATNIAFSEDARAIMEKVKYRKDGKSLVGKSKLSTCRYVMKDYQMVCTENPRVKVFELVRKDYDAGEQDKKTVSIIVDPPGEKGISFLQYDYKDSTKNSDQWMYLPALKKVKRIVPAGKDEPKTGSFFGSEISYEDMEQKPIDNYSYKVLKSEIYNDSDCWVIEIIPNESQSKKSSYSKSVSWVDKERDLVIKTDLYDKNGNLLKQDLALYIKDVNGIWTITNSIMKNVQTKRMTTMSSESVAYNVDVNDVFLSLRTLTDMVFRESNLQNYRKFITSVRN